MTGVEVPVVIAAEYPVLDYTRWRTIRDSRAGLLASLGVLSRWSYHSLVRPNYVCAGVMVRSVAQALAVLREGEAAEWLKDAGVDEFPAFFVGHCVGSVQPQGRATIGADPVSRTFAADAEHIAVTIHTVPDLDQWQRAIRTPATLASLEAAGVRRLWLYQAVDDTNEFMTALEMGSAAMARAIPRNPQLDALLVKEDRVPYHPGVFVGRRTKADHREGLPVRR